MILLGLTGSVASGKSEVAKLFAAEGIPVFDSDAVVHSLYAEAATVNQIGRAFPDVIVDGKIDRALLGNRVLGSPEALEKLESLVHPLVRKRRDEFISLWQKQNCPIVILDIPLLYETGAELELDYVIVVSASEVIRRARAMSRPGMTIEKYTQILARQMPDAEKRRRADFVIENSGSLEDLRSKVDALRKKLAELVRNQKS